jgi:hypothetical protein
MSESYVNQAAGSTSGTVNLTVPTGVQGQDVLVMVASAATTSITTPAGWDLVRTETPSTGLTATLYKKVAAGSAGSPSSDIGAAIAVAPGTAGIHTAASLVAWRGVDPTAPINVSNFVAYTSGTTSWTGPSVTTTVDGCDILTAIVDKNSVNPINFTPPSGYTTRASAVPSSGTGKTDSVIASKAGGSAGNYGADAWATDATPGTVGVFTVALTPIVTTQTVRPTSDVSSTSATGVADATHLYANIDEAGSADPSDYVEMTATGYFEVGVATLSDPGTTSGWAANYTGAFGTLTVGAVWAVTFYQGTTSIETWNHTQSADNDSQIHALNPTNVANVVFTSGTATNLRLKFSLTSVS